MTTFWLLLRRKEKKESDFIVSFLLIFIGIALIAIIEPFGPEVNALLMTALFSPFIAYLISILKVRRDFEKRVDEASYDYRKRMIEQESALIGSLIGELTSHSAAFTADDWPVPSELSDKKWNESNKVGLISDIHTNWLAKYYHYIPYYNNLVRNIKKLENVTDFQSIQEKFLAVKQAYLGNETILYHTLVYDLGLLQQTYLARPAVEFPLHMSILLKRKMQKFGILTENEEIGKHIYGDKISKEFTLKIGRSFNASFAQLEIALKLLVREIEKISKQKQLPDFDKSK